MKTISVAIFTFFLLQTAGMAQVKTNDKAIIKTPTVLCDVCKDRVEFFISHTEGVTSVSVDIRKKTTKVTWITDRTDIETIRVAIANLGFDADDVEAEETAFKRLPKTCQAHKPPVKPPVPAKE